MAGIKDTLSKGLTTLNVKTNSFMEQNKSNTYISTLESEIKALELQIGQAVYEQWTQGEFSVESVEGQLQTIKEKQEEIAQQKQHIEEMLRQEQQILGANSAPSKEGNFCPKCGAQCAPNAKFCAKCGEALNA